MCLRPDSSLRNFLLLKLAACAVLAAGSAAAQTTNSYTIDTVAGTEDIGDGAAATAARLWNPSGVAVDGAGNLYIVDRDNHRIRKVAADGIISTFAGGGNPADASGDGGPAAAARLNFPADAAMDGAGNLYIADTRNHRIRKVDANGIISTLAGTGAEGFSGDDGPATAAQLRSPSGLATDGAGNLYIADTGNHRIRKMDGDGIIASVAGTGTEGFSGDGGPATAAQLWSPFHIAIDTADNIYIADRGNQRIRKIGVEGNISTVAGGMHVVEGIGDGGPATEAQLILPLDVAADGEGNVYIADFIRIRRVDAAGNISTFAGTWPSGYSGDGGPAVEAHPTRDRGQDRQRLYCR